MFYEVVGDILLSEAQAIGHGVAPNDNFKQGLALSLREEMPELYKEFRSHMHKEHLPEGALWKWTSAEGKCVFNLFTQEHAKGHGQTPGKAKTSYVNHCLRELRNSIEKEGVSSIALPKIATGVGGLKWEEVKPLIEKYLQDLDIPVYLYTTYVQGKKAKEPRS